MSGERLEARAADAHDRVCSEDPSEGFRPASGAVETLNFQSNQNVRWFLFGAIYAGVAHRCLLARKMLHKCGAHINLDAADFKHRVNTHFLSS